MNAGLHLLEIIAAFFGLVSLVIFSASVIAAYGFSHKVRTTRRIDPHERKRLKRWLIIGPFLSGICVPMMGLALSLVPSPGSPEGLERMTLSEVLFSFLFCGGSSAVGGVVLYLYTIWRWKFLLEYFYEQEGPDDSRRDKPDIESSASAPE